MKETMSGKNLQIIYCMNMMIKISQLNPKKET